MYNTEYENGVLICNIHRTPISKSHGRFFCLKCQQDRIRFEREEQNIRNQTDIAHLNDVRFG